MAQIKKVWFDEDRMFPKFKYWRTADVAVKWFPNLNKGNLEQLENYVIRGDNQYIHRPDLNEDISAETLITLSVHGLPTGVLPDGA